MDKIDRDIITLYNEGHSIIAIAGRLDISRGIVSHRVEMLARDNHIKKRGHPKPKPIPGFSGDPSYAGTVKALQELRRDQCKWPIGDTRSPDFRFCCEKITSIGKCYCDLHWSESRTKSKYTPRKKWKTVEE